jgi:hypothetical protein
MALLCHWGQQSLKDMMSLGTDFEMHAIWQGYVEDPAAKDFVARKAHNIVLSEAQGTQQSTLFTSLEIPWGFLTQAVLRSLPVKKCTSHRESHFTCERWFSLITCKLLSAVIPAW